MPSRAEPERITRVPVSVSTPAPRDLWWAAHAADPGARPTQLPEWQDSIVARGGWRDASRLYEFSPSRFVVLPLVVKQLGPLRLALASWPDGWGIGGPLAAGGVAPDELAAIRTDLAGLGAIASRLLIAGVAPHSATDVVTPRTVQALSLEGGFEHVQSTRFESETRRLIRRAAGSGLVVTRGNDQEQLAAFTEVYAASVHRWADARRQNPLVARALARSRDHPGQVAAAIATMGEQCEVWVARLEGFAVAAMVTVHDATRSVGWMAASDLDRVGKTRAQHLLHSLVIEDACARGSSEIDFGESDPGSGVEEWKKRFGAEHQPISEIRTERIPISRAEAFARRLVNRRQRKPNQ